MSCHIIITLNRPTSWTSTPVASLFLKKAQYYMLRAEGFSPHICSAYSGWFYHRLHFFFNVGSYHDNLTSQPQTIVTPICRMMLLPVITDFIHILTLVPITTIWLPNDTQSYIVTSICRMILLPFIYIYHPTAMLVRVLKLSAEQKFPSLVSNTIAFPICIPSNSNVRMWPWIISVQFILCMYYYYIYM